MATIPGWAYAAVGAAMALYSKFVQSRMPENKVMVVFFWVGILMIAIGAFKLALRYLLGKKEKPNDRDPEHRTPRRQPASGGALSCPRCNAKLHSQSKYCNWCGTEQ